MSRAGVLEFEWAAEPRGGLVKAQISGLTPRVFDAGSLGWSLIICIFNRFPGDAEVAGLGNNI